MTLLVLMGLGLLSFVTMEGVAWLAHRYLMHGALWFLHKDHHQPHEKRGGFFEKNDWFFVIFALPSMVLYILGSIYSSPYLFAVAIGISLYGIAYFLFHEVVFHRRLSWFKRWKPIYVRAVKRAHAAHHKHLTAEQGECFGLLVFPLKYYRLERSNQ